MSWSHLDGTMSNFFLAGMLLCVPIFKIASLICLRKRIDDRSLFYLVAPVMTPEALYKSKLTTPGLILQRLHHAAHGMLAVVIGYGICGVVIRRYAPPEVVLSYLAIPIIYAWGEALGPVGQVLHGMTGRIPGPVHNWPHRATSIGNFWSSRWNSWTQEFLSTCVFSPLRRRPTLAIGVVFLVSGVLHELLINLPLYLYVHRNLFGSQVAYFAIQGAGVLIDRKYFRKFPKARRVFLWCVVILPAPLLVNEGLLRIVHIWP